MQPENPVVTAVMIVFVTMCYVGLFCVAAFLAMVP